MLKLNQVGTYTFNIEGTINEKVVSVRVVVTKNGYLQSMKGTGSAKFKKEVGKFLHSNGLINELAYKLC